MHTSAFVRRAAGGLGLGLLTAGLVALPSMSAQAVSTTLVINEVYVNGGSAGAAYTNKYVEVFNKSASAIDLTGMSLQYRAPGSTGASGNTCALTGTVAAGGYYLVQGGSNGTVGAALPTPDQSCGSINPGGAGGTITLASGVTAVDPSTSTAVIDKLGYGTSNSPEAATASGNSVTQSLSRSSTSADTDNNSADFAAANPTPDAVNPGTTTTPPPTNAGDKTIAEIQGTGAASPFAGQTVKTRGVVTASYPTGGLNGFYIQTPGADTANASDGIFVYGGSAGFTVYPAVGASVEVTGDVSEFFGTTQITATQTGVVPVAALGTVAPKAQIPGTDCTLPGAGCLVGTALDQAREVAEGELFQPTAPWTATDVYDGGPYYNDGTNSSAMRGELGVAANSDKPLVAPTEVIDAQDVARVDERKNYNAAHRIILDDGASLTFSTTQNNDQPFPWFTKDHYVRVGARITFPKPVIFTFGFNAWRILPQSRVTGDSTGTVDFEQNRPAAPQTVGGDLKLATFNVLNFFPTTGEEFVATGLGTCTYFSDRAGNRITNNSCNPNGPRGAANEENLKRQRDKIVAAINTANADIVSLEELENSVKFNKDRDYAINELIKALNAAAGAGTWAAVPSAPVLPPTAEQDVIRNGFIFKPAKVALVGASVVLSDESSAGEAFEDAREPVAQAFKRVGTRDADAFAVIVNHFKSKGSGTADPLGQGNANDRRIAQANSLVNFANGFKTQRGITRVFLAGDFNAYSEEDPIQVLRAAGYNDLKSTSNPDEESYNFDGMVGSLDHVLANAPALGDVSGVDIWDINGYESLYYEYSRFNTNVTNLYAPNPYRSSDHSPEIVGIRAPLPITTPPSPNAVVPDVTAVVTPDPIIVDRTRAVVRAKVTRSGQAVTTGTVEVSNRGRILGTAPVANGGSTIRLPRFHDTGYYVLDVSYVDADGVTYATQEVAVRVRKSRSDIRVVRAGGVAGQPAVLRIKVLDPNAASGVARGWARIKFQREWHSMKLVGGRATWSLGRLAPQIRKVVVRYNGNKSTTTDRQVAKVRVTRG